MDTQPTPDNALELAPGVWIAPGEVKFSFSRSSGPGGQSVNKLSTKAELRVEVRSIVGLPDSAQARLRRLAGRRLTQRDELLFQADTHRSQLENKRACIDRLRTLVVDALNPPKPRKARRISRAMILKRLDAKRKRADKKSARRWRPGASD
ncbi:MAG: aminoacyl-tRNA hydrolase [Planctomycetes bacterium]|nr:aminoacyl-tRNA hydrolase [Planctomycetota bacterium]